MKLDQIKAARAFVSRVDEALRVHKSKLWVECWLRETRFGVAASLKSSNVDCQFEDFGYIGNELCNMILLAIDHDFFIEEYWELRKAGWQWSDVEVWGFVVNVEVRDDDRGDACLLTRVDLMDDSGESIEERWRRWLHRPCAYEFLNRVGTWLVIMDLELSKHEPKEGV